MSAIISLLVIVLTLGGVIVGWMGAVAFMWILERRRD